MVAAPEAKETVTVEMKETVEKSTIVAQKAKEAEKIKDDSAPTGSKDVSEDPDNSEKLAKATEKFAAGKKALSQNLAQDAVEALAEACGLMSSVHGDMSPKMCEFYYYYGRALLELARIEEDVLGNALTGVPEGDDVENSQIEDPDKLTEEERETVAEQVDEALKENFKTSETLKEKKSSTETEEEKSESKEDSTKDKEMDKKEQKKVESDVKIVEKSESDKKEEKKTESAIKEEKKADSAVKGGNKSDKEEEKKESDEMESTDKVEKMEEDETTVEKSNGATEDSKSEDSEEKTDDEEEEEGEVSAEGEAVEGEEQASQDGEDVSSLQLSWEVLELAKTIYEKNENRTKDETLRLSQVYLKLGEVCLENENYPESINMNNECLKLQEASLSADDRWLAETHYQLGLSYSMADNFDEAVKHLESATNVIDSRIRNNTDKLQKDLIKQSDDLDETKLSEEQKNLVKDVKELKKLLPQLKEKIADIKETKASFTEKVKALKDMMDETHLMGELGGASSSGTGFGDSSVSTSSNAKPIATSMIRKKRKPDEEASTEEKDSKKAKTEVKVTEEKTTNGSAEVSDKNRGE